MNPTIVVGACLLLVAVGPALRYLRAFAVLWARDIRECRRACRSIARQLDADVYRWQ